MTFLALEITASWHAAISVADGADKTLSENNKLIINNNFFILFPLVRVRIVC